MPGSLRLRATGLACLAACCLALTGCGSSQDDAVDTAAGAFYEAVATGDGDGACAVLAPVTLAELEQSSGRPCPEAVLSEEIPDVAAPEGIEVFGTMAQVRYDGEVAFLTRFEDGWRIVAAACTPARSRYDCSVQGA
jgi:hypothetical protein